MTAIEFLLAQQSEDGAWRDFLLKPGRSDSWVTAYVGLRLLQAAGAWPGPRVVRARAAAVRFIQSSRHERGGWGYNGNCPPDADSTAHAILFLRQAGARPALRDYAVLARFQLRDGAFATYAPGDARGGWCRGHPDVTAVALRAMAGLLSSGHVIMRRGYARLAGFLARREQTASYWWPSALYLARELLVLSRDVPGAPAFTIPRLNPAADASCVERALALDIARLRDGTQRRRDERAPRALGKLQLRDGSWPSSPILRVVDPSSKRWNDRRCRTSPVVADDRRIFTTATVTAALAATHDMHSSP